MIFIGGNALDTPEGLVASQMTENLLNSVIFRDGRTVRFTIGSVSPESEFTMIKYWKSSKIPLSGASRSII